MAQIDVRFMESDIKSKLKSAIDLGALYGVFESLVSAFSSQQEEIRVLQNRLESRTDDIKSLSSSLQTMNEKVQALEYNIHANSADRSSESSFVMYSDSRHPDSRVDVKGSGSVTQQSSSSEKVNKRGAGARSSLKSSIGVEMYEDYYDLDDPRFHKLDMPGDSSSSLVPAKSALDEKIAALAQKELEEEAKRHKIGANDLPSRSSWRAKRHRLLLALLQKGKGIRSRRIALARGTSFIHSSHPTLKIIHLMD